jgi:thioesterase III
METPVYEVVIRESHLDTFGHVNNATYLTLFEEARWDIVRSRGFGLDDIKRTGLGPTLLEVNVKWKKEIRNRERIRIRTEVSSATGKVQTLHQVMLNDQDEEVCVADYVIALFDVKARKIVPPTPEWKAAIGIRD